jgi:hypothetical protein
MFLGSKARPVCRAENLTATCEPIVYTIWDPQHLTPPRPGTGTAFPLLPLLFIQSFWVDICFLKTCKINWFYICCIYIGHRSH